MPGPAPAALAPAQLQMVPSAAQVMMECLCQLQEQGGYQQMAASILAGDLQRALRSFRALSRRAPRPLQKSADTEPDPLQQAFTGIGAALAAGDEAGARKIMKELQEAVAFAHAHHRHGRTPEDAGAGAADAKPAPNPGGGQIDIKV